MSSTASQLGLRLIPVTASFAVPFTLTGALLSFNVVQKRLALNTFQGDSTISADGKVGAKVKQPDGNEYDPLLIATRIHSNFIENVPYTLLLAGLAELNGADKTKLTYTLALFWVMRVSHVLGLNNAILPARGFGTCLLLLALLR